MLDGVICRMKRSANKSKRCCLLTIVCTLISFVGCQSALYNTYPVPGEGAGDGLKYYRSAFPRGQRPDPWEQQNEARAESERADDAKEDAATESQTSQ